MRVFDVSVASVSLPPNFALKRRRLAGRVLNLKVDLYSHVRESVTRLVETAFVLRLAVIVIVPEQPCDGDTGSGRCSFPVTRKEYGFLRSRLGRRLSERLRGLKRRTAIGRTTLVVWLAPSIATATSVLRPTSAPRG